MHTARSTQLICCAQRLVTALFQVLNMGISLQNRAEDIEGFSKSVI